eukprot:698353-Amphidinium_carterae.1
MQAGAGILLSASWHTHTHKQKVWKQLYTASMSTFQGHFISPKHVETALNTTIDETAVRHTLVNSA